MRRCLPEAETGIDDDRVRADPGRQRPLNGRLQLGDHLDDDVAVPRLGAVVHEDDRHAAVSGEPDERIVGRHAPHVVEQGRAGVEGGGRDGRLRRVDADREIRQGRVDRRDHRHDAGSLHGCIHLLMTRPGRLSAHVEEVGTLGGHAPRLPDGSLRDGGPRIRGCRRRIPREEPVAGEGIGRDVDDAHDVRPGAPGERPRPDAGLGRPLDRFPGPVGERGRRGAAAGVGPGFDDAVLGG